ncbi:hypothetical protein VULLAG_LOCUS15607 [Vulpes lagopus]
MIKCSARSLLSAEKERLTIVWARHCPQHLVPSPNPTRTPPVPPLGYPKPKRGLYNHHSQHLHAFDEDSQSDFPSRMSITTGFQSHHQLRIWSFHTWANIYHFPTPTLCHLCWWNNAWVSWTWSVVQLQPSGPPPNLSAHTAGRVAVPFLSSHRNQGFCSPWGRTWK